MKISCWANQHSTSFQALLSNYDTIPTIPTNPTAEFNNHTKEQIRTEQNPYDHITVTSGTCNRMKKQNSQRTVLVQYAEKTKQKNQKE